MNDIEIRFSGVEAKADELHQAAQKVQEIDQFLGDVLNALKPVWQDPAQDAFEKSYLEMKEEFPKIAFVLEAMSDTLRFAVTTYQETDKKIQAMF